MIEQASLVIGNDNFAVKENSFLGYAINQGFYVPREMDVVRATTATRVNENGLIELVAYNLLTYSEQFNNAAWTKVGSTISENAIIAPNGTLTADKLIEDTSNGLHSGARIGAMASAGTYTLSIYAKAGERTSIAIGNASAGHFAIFDLSLGTVVQGSQGTVTNGAISSIDSNGYYRISCNITITSLSSISVSLVSTGTTTSYLGNGTSGLFVWGAQLVEGTSAKTYFPTTDRLDVPRVDYSNGTPSILVEPQRTNLALYSEQFDNAYWLKGNTTVTANQTISPDGTQNADTLLATSGMTSFLYRSFTLTSGTPYTFSIYVKKKTITALGNRFRINFVNNLFVNFNGSVPVITGGSGIIENAGNGFYRIITTVTPSVTSNTLYIYPDGNNNNADEYYIWGAQLEAGSNATSYIPTIASSVTRNADVISKTGISSLINSVEGSFYVEASSFVNGGSFRQFSLSNGTDNSRLTMGWSSISSRLLVRLDIGGTNIVNTDILSFNQTSNNKVLFKWGGGNFKVFINGVEKLSLTSLTMPTANLFTKLGFDRGSNAGFFEGNVKSVLVFPNVLTDQECINLTTL